MSLKLLGELALRAGLWNIFLGLIAFLVLSVSLVGVELVGGWG